jgi:hypothetical protein
MDALLPGGALIDQGLVQPDLGAEVLPAGRGELALPCLAGVGVDPVVSDLGSVQVQPAYDAHREPPSSSAYVACSTIIRA